MLNYLLHIVNKIDLISCHFGDLYPWVLQLFNTNLVCISTKINTKIQIMLGTLTTHIAIVKVS
jgi:hypothetical protein